MLKVKLCGFKEIETLETAIKMQADFIGFIFHENSPRYIFPEDAAKLAKIIPTNIAKVAVTVDADLKTLEEIASTLKPEFFQLHGNESKEQVLKIKNHFKNIKLIKAFKMNEIEKTQDFEDLCEFFMFDNIVAGSGKSWDYNILKNINLKKPWFLSGGLNIDNILEAVTMSGAKMIDVSSGIEKERGVKSSELIFEFMKKVKTIN